MTIAGTLPRILLAEDHALVAAGLARLLEHDAQSLSIVADGREAVEAAVREKPDIVLLDIRMPVMTGLEAARRIRSELPQTKIIFVTVHSDPVFIAEALRIGASGYLLKGCSVGELRRAMQEVIRGAIYITPLVDYAAARRLLDHPAVQPALTRKQREVLNLVSKGWPSKTIAKELKISSKTVEFHKGNIMRQLNLHSIAGLTRYALEHEAELEVELNPEGRRRS